MKVWLTQKNQALWQNLDQPKKGLKSIRKAAKQEGYLFDKDELADALNEMDQAGAFVIVELDDADLDALLGTGDIFKQEVDIDRFWIEKQLWYKELIERLNR